MNTEINPEWAREAFEMLKPHIETVTEVRRTNVNLQKVAIFAAAMGRRVRRPEMREQLAALPATVFDVDHVDMLEPAALALWHALVEFKRAAVGSSQAALDGDVVEKATALKRRMVRVLEYHLGDDDAARPELGSIREGAGYVDLATDLMRLARLYEEHEAALAGDARHYDPADREEAKRMTRVIMRDLGEKRPGDAALWSSYVSRTWTLLADIYDEVSAAGRFLFRHDDAESLFPSLVAISRDRPSRAPEPGQPEDTLLAQEAALPPGNGALAPN